MFGFFKKKEAQVKVIDKIWLTEQAKWQACLDLYRRNNATRFIAWFEESKNKLGAFFNSQVINDPSLSLAGFQGNTTGGPLLFIEHHPLQEEEQQQFKDLGLNEVIVLSALDEPLFLLFGGAKIAALMQKMGLTEEEGIENNMISASIKNAQAKISKKAMLITSASSQSDWLTNAGINNL